MGAAHSNTPEEPWTPLFEQLDHFITFILISIFFCNRQSLGATPDMPVESVEGMEEEEGAGH